MKLCELENIFNKIRELLKYVEESGILNKKFRFYVANGDQIDYQMTKESIPHLLGINTAYLSSTKIFNTTNSYELLEDLLDSEFKINKLYSEGIINYDQLFSKHIYTKLENFKENIDININNISFAIKYDSSRSYQIDDEKKNYKYILVCCEKDKTRLLCLGKLNDRLYAPMSNQAYDNEEDLNKTFEKLITNQEITYISGINYMYIYDFDPKKTYLNLKNKSLRMNILSNLKDKYNASIDVNREYSYLLNGASENRQKNFNDETLIEDIVENIKDGKIIETKTNNNNLNLVISAFNDFIFSGAVLDDTNTASFTEQSEELIKLKRQIDELKELKDDLIKENKDVKDKNEILTLENQNINNACDNFFELIKKARKM